MAKEKMSKEDLLFLLESAKRVADTGDCEEAHSMADCALLSYIDDAEIEAAFDAIDKWYS